MDEGRLSELAKRHGISVEQVEQLLGELGDEARDEPPKPAAPLAPELANIPASDDAPTIEVSVTPKDLERKHISSLFAKHQTAEGVANALIEGDPGESGERAILPDLSAAAPEEGDGLGMEMSLPSREPHRIIRTAEGKIYQDMGLLGMGGLGEVRRVRDVTLGRPVALKMLHREYLDEPALVARFIEEAQVTAQLQHPGVAPVHELGRLEDGRIYFTMKEIKGRTLREAIEEVHAVSGRNWRTSPTGWTFRRLIDTFLRICEAVAFTHKRGAIHRDLKPDNVMLGDHGEVLVVDWGLVKVRGRTSRGRPVEHVESVRSRTGKHDTHTGMISGTPAYMSPEQACGDNHAVNERSDIYALGAILYEILSGTPPYSGDSPREILERVLTGPPVPLSLTQLLHPGKAVTDYTDTNITNVWTTSKLPDDLVQLCERSMARDPTHRPHDAQELVDAVKTWLEGDFERARAREFVAMAREALAQEEELRREASDLQARAEAMLERLEPWEDDDAKAQAWSLEERAEQLMLEVSLKSLEAEQLLNGALLYAQDDEEAHKLLADRYRAEHERAERERDREAALRAEALLASHLYALPDDNPTKRTHTAYLRGDGRVDLRTRPEGAVVTARRLERRNRRLIEGEPLELGEAPLTDVALPMGSYMLTIQAPGHVEVRYPIKLERQAKWGGVRPGDEQPHALRLPREGDLGEEDVFVPAGWFWAGSASRARKALPPQRVWLDSFIIKRFPVTNREYIEFLDEMVLLGRESQALRHVPRARSNMRDDEGQPLYRLEDDGFVLAVEGGRDAWEMDWPVFMITWESANAYARWYSMRTGQVWRLPYELEWEKAARGVDGRTYPWGDFFDPSWCCTEESHSEQSHPQLVHSYPTDVSPYGVRGMAGNIMDFCADVWRSEGPEIRDGRFIAGPVDLSEGLARVARGASWNRGAHMARTYHRFLSPRGLRADFIGFRLARSL